MPVADGTLALLASIGSLDRASVKQQAAEVIQACNTIFGQTFAGPQPALIAHTAIVVSMPAHPGRSVDSAMCQREMVCPVLARLPCTSRLDALCQRRPF